MTPLLVVAGFLGAGKTTFLRGLVPALAGRGLRARVVLNDFKDARIDGATLADLVPDLVALSGSCVCCESLEDLLAILGQLRGQPGDVVVLEANGGTESSDLLALLAGAPELTHLTPPLQLTLIDGRRFGTRGWQNAMEREQLVTATHVHLSRVDLVSPERAAEVRQAVSALAPTARWVAPAEMAEALVAIEATARAATPRGIGAGAASDRADIHGHPQGHAQGHAHAHAHGHGPHDHDPHPFAAHVVELPSPVDPQAFVDCLAALPPEVLRAKGIVVLRDPPGEKRSFQKVGDEVEISPCQLAEPEALAARGVFIGPRLPIALIEARLRALG